MNSSIELATLSQEAAGSQGLDGAQKAEVTEVPSARMPGYRPSHTPRLVSPSRKAQTSAESVRCREKGCVFPAHRNGSGLCLCHQRQELEPDRFGSTQPTWFVLHQSAGPDESAGLRAESRDRHRLAAQSKAFQQGRV